MAVGLFKCRFVLKLGQFIWGEGGGASRVKLISKIDKFSSWWGRVGEVCTNPHIVCPFPMSGSPDQLSYDVHIRSHI